MQAIFSVKASAGRIPAGANIHAHQDLPLVFLEVVVAIVLTRLQLQIATNIDIAVCGLDIASGDRQITCCINFEGLGTDIGTRRVGLSAFLYGIGLRQEGEKFTQTIMHGVPILRSDLFYVAEMDIVSLERDTALRGDRCAFGGDRLGA